MRWSDPIRVDLDIPLGRVRRPAVWLTVALPVAMMAAGVPLAVVSAVRAEEPATEAIGTLGTELGAVLWFAGAITLGARRAATVTRIALLAATLLAGLSLVALALVRRWTGAGLALAMEFGVGAIGVAVIDTVLLGVLYRGVERVADGSPDHVVRIGLGRRRH